MAMNILVLQHHHAEGPGRITHWAKQHAITLTVVMAEPFFNASIADAQALTSPQTSIAALTTSLQSFDAIIVLGGPMHVGAGDKWLQYERQFIGLALASNVPILGICLGAQLLAAELGAKISPLEQAELGWQQITFHTNNDNQPSGTSTLLVLQWHEQGFYFNDNHITIEASSSLCEQQIFSGKRFLGLQFHPEWDLVQIGKLKQAFGTACPFDLMSKASAQAEIEEWFFQRLSQLFLQ
ncbi:type 1 glutamine amidotransferase [Shewanella intestini]|uniref:Type 1 glutamine amidotransferase n=1 Tax=Shewanella intestini TaxID=2017544 RepID=A0ABS5I5W5_9GAMM|nr:MULTISPECIES: type 1 glutamine amidotransferase [Shewanella]MBR9729104.1 type 1 glutamine amidotransferase [Shewanella intestini]MRG37180.1 hypothetical protein [Shewanella sp. XMDDZSB0408]